MRYCVRCLYNDCKPDLIFDAEGVCSACRAFEQRAEVDWSARKTEFLEIVERNKSHPAYDCLIPVSGGKDSHYQVIKCKELGLNPLCVTATTDSLSDIGRRNIENLKSLGVDYIEVTLNPKIRRKLNRYCLTDIGDISWPEHVAIFTVPVRVAIQNNIRLIVWGENPQNEYGGPGATSKRGTLTREWLEEFGGLLGMRVSDFEGFEGITERDLFQYTYPAKEELINSGVTGIFLGHFFPWDGFRNAIIAQAHGFETFQHNVEGSLCNYENLDNHQTGIHDYFKFLKFGFGRATDIANNHIRRGRLSYAEARGLVKLHDGKFPHTCLGKPLSEILAEIDMTMDDFKFICDRFTNWKIFGAENPRHPDIAA